MADTSQNPDSQARVNISNKRGLHARAAAKFVSVAGRFHADVSVSRNGAVVSGKSIMGLMMLAASPGSSIDILAKGPDADQAVDALVKLVEGRFDED